MSSFLFCDDRGRSWLAVPGLPAEHPANAMASAVPLVGVTFVADGGEVRVLALGDFPRRVDVPGHESVASAPQRPPRWLDFAALLPHAQPWPPRPPGRDAF